MISTLQIDAGRLRRNFALLSRVAACEVLAVIKADAYGHGATLCAPALAAAGARWLGVTDPGEGAAVRTALRATGMADDAVQLLVMVGLDPTECTGCDLIANARLTPVIWTLAQLQALERAARASGHTIDAHVEIDSGMSRQGVRPGSDAHALFTALRASTRVRMTGLMSHLACAEVRGAAETLQAREHFAAVVEYIAEHGPRPAWVHLENTSAVDEGGSAACLRAFAARLGAKAMVRSGLGLYGYAAPLEQAEADAGTLQALEPALRWVAPVTDVRQLDAGDAVGYGATFHARQRMRVALVPVGYADGFTRAASGGRGYVLLGGQRAAVVGRVSMNLIVVDVSALAEVRVGDPAVVLGPGVDAWEHARWRDTIAYEVLCGLRGPRCLTDAGEA